MMHLSWLASSRIQEPQPIINALVAISNRLMLAEIELDSRSGGDGDDVWRWLGGSY